MITYLNKPTLAYNFGIYRILIYSIFFIIYGFHFYYAPYETTLISEARVLISALLITSIFNIIGFKFKFFSILQFILNAILYTIYYHESTSVFFFKFHVGHDLFFLLFLNLLLPLSNSLSIDSLKDNLTKYVPFYNYFFYYLLIGAFYFYAALFKAIDINYYDKDFLQFLTIQVNSLVSLDNLFLKTLKELGFSFYSGILILIYQFLMLPILLFFRNTIIKTIFLFCSIIIHISFMFYFNLFLLTWIVIFMYIPLFNSRAFISLLKLFKNKQDKIIVYYDDYCSKCSSAGPLLKVFNFKRNVVIKPLSFNQKYKNTKYMPIEYKNKVYLGLDGFQIIFKNNLILYPFNFILKLSFFNKLYKNFAENRKRECSLPFSKKEKQYPWIFMCTYFIIVAIYYNIFFIDTLKNNKISDYKGYSLVSFNIPIFPLVPNMFTFYNYDKNILNHYVVKSNGVYYNELKDKEKHFHEYFINFEEMKRSRLARLYNRLSKNDYNISQDSLKNRINHLNNLFSISLNHEDLHICKREYIIKDYRKLYTKEDLIFDLKNSKFNESCFSF